MLTEVKLKALKPKSALYRVADSAGLCIEVAATGSKLWRYRFDRKAKVLSFGPWPLITFATARAKRDDARRLLFDGVNPMEAKRGDVDDRQRRARGMFPVIAAELLAHKKKSVAADTFRKAKMVTEGDLIPAVRRHSIQTLATKDCTKVYGTSRSAHRTWPRRRGSTLRHRRLRDQGRPARRRATAFAPRRDPDFRQGAVLDKQLIQNEK